MAKTIKLIPLLMLLLLYIENTYEQNEDNMGGKISLSVPQLSEEESSSNHMPSHLKCDACLAVVFQLYSSILHEQTKLSKDGKRKPLKEYEIIDIIEDTCNKGFDGYGAKQVDGINRLSGPGLETEKVMGMTQMGGRWPHRLQEMCHYYVGEAGELDIYEMSNESKSKLTEYLCYGKGIYGHCTSVKPASKIEL